MLRVGRVRALTEVWERPQSIRGNNFIGCVVSLAHIIVGLFFN
jgi:hypothetical protein